MAAAASILGVSCESLSAAKAAGCPAFKGSRVNVAILKKWTAQNKDKISQAGDIGGIKLQILIEDLRKKKTDNDRKDKILVNKSKSDADTVKAGKALESVMKQVLLKDVPFAAANQDTPAIQIIMEGAYDKIITTWEKVAAE